MASASFRSSCPGRNRAAKVFPAVVIKEVDRDYKKAGLRYKSPETCYNEGHFVYKRVFPAVAPRRRIR